VISVPFFLDGTAGALFAVHHRPDDGVPQRGHVLVVPPFNEEMNRCRSMLTLLAHALSDLGMGMLVLDLFGTGDSHGDYVDARWSHWLADLDTGRRWLEAQPGGCRALLGVRLGAILAAQWLSAVNDPRIALALWQPVTDGKTHLTQFMRVRIAAHMDRSDLPKETTTSMRAQLAAGQPVEIAGYELHPELTQAIDGAALGAHALPAGTRLLWLEHVAAAGDEISPASRQLLANWPGPGMDTHVRTFEGPAFWQVHERLVAPQAVERTCAWFQQLSEASR